MAELLGDSRELILKAQDGEHAICHCNGSVDGLSECKTRTEAMGGEDILLAVKEARLKCMKAGFAQLRAQMLKLTETQPGQSLPIEAKTHKQ